MFSANAIGISLLFRNNIVMTQIGFAQLSVETMASSPAQTVSGFLSDLGGQLGLFAGISVITICELLEYPFVKLWSIVRGKDPESENEQEEAAKDKELDSKV